MRDILYAVYMLENPRVCPILLVTTGINQDAASSAYLHPPDPTQRLDPLALPPDPSHLMDPFDLPHSHSSQQQPHPMSHTPLQQPQAHMNQSSTQQQQLSAQQQPQSFPTPPSWQQSHGYSPHSQGFTHSHSFPATGSAAEPETINIDIITPGIWTSFNHAPHSSNTVASGAQQPTEVRQVEASAPPMPFEAERQPVAMYSTSAPAAASQHWIEQGTQDSPQRGSQSSAQQGLHAAGQLLKPAGSNKRSVASNTQLTMQRSIVGNVSDARFGSQQSRPAEESASGTAVSEQAQHSSRAFSKQVGALPQMQVPHEQHTVGMSQMNSGQYGSDLAQTFSHSGSVGSLSSMSGMDEVDRRNSGQVPMRAGSPALGGRASSRPPTWSAQKHDPFGELVSQDIRSTSSKSIDSTNTQGRS